MAVHIGHQMARDDLGLEDHRHRHRLRPRLPVFSHGGVAAWTPLGRSAFIIVVCSRAATRWRTWPRRSTRALVARSSARTMQQSGIARWPATGTVAAAGAP
jgi:hypothetical protein